MARAKIQSLCDLANTHPGALEVSNQMNVLFRELAVVMFLAVCGEMEPARIVPIFDRSSIAEIRESIVRFDSVKVPNFQSFWALSDEYEHDEDMKADVPHAGIVEEIEFNVSAAGLLWDELSPATVGPFRVSSLAEHVAGRRDCVIGEIVDDLGIGRKGLDIVALNHDARSPGTSLWPEPAGVDSTRSARSFYGFASPKTTRFALMILQRYKPEALTRSARKTFPAGG
jgi:hypothetical protein